MQKRAGATKCREQTQKESSRERELESAAEPVLCSRVVYQTVYHTQMWVAICCCFHYFCCCHPHPQPTPIHTHTHTNTHSVRRSCKFADVVELCGRHCIFGLTFRLPSPTLLFFYFVVFFVSCRLQPIFMSPFCCCLLLLAHLIANIAHNHTQR